MLRNMSREKTSKKKTRFPLMITDIPTAGFEKISFDYYCYNSMRSYEILRGIPINDPSAENTAKALVNNFI